MAQTENIRGKAIERASTLPLALAPTLVASGSTIAVDMSGLTDRVSAVVTLRRLAYTGTLGAEWSARALARARDLHAECEVLLGPED